MQKTQCSTFKIVTCETFLKNTKILSFSKKETQKLCILQKKKMPGKKNFFHFTPLCQISKP